MEFLAGTSGLILLIVAVLWIMVPFLIMGVNKRLDKLNSNIITMGRLLKKHLEENEQE